MVVTAYTDGAYSHQSDVGGWALCICSNMGVIFSQKSGGAIHTTHNRMELLAVLSALEEAVDNPRYKYLKELNIISDSKYVVNPIHYNNLESWVKNDWQRYDGSGEIKNQDLWKRVYRSIVALENKKVRVNVRWVRGHSGNTHNEWCDTMAVWEKSMMFHRAKKEARIKQVV